MGADRAANRISHGGPYGGFSKIRFAATAVRWHGFNHRRSLPTCAAAGAFLPEDVQPVQKHERSSVGRAWLSFQRRWEPGGWFAPEWQRLRQSPEHLPLQ